MARISNAEFLKNMLEIDDALKAEGKEPILTAKLRAKIEDVQKRSADIKADPEMTNLLFNQLFNKDTREL